MTKEIGGDFHISFEDLDVKENHFKDYFGLSNRFYLLVDSGRTALYIILKDILNKVKSKPVVYIPNYLCESVITPIKQLDMEIRYYNVLENQKIISTELTNLPDYSIILRICFFGDPTLPLIKSANRNKIFIIDDFSHNPYLITKTDIDSNYIIVSLRKYFPVPDGGLVISNSPLVDIKLVSDTYWSELKASGMILKNAYHKNPTPKLKEKFLSLLRESENTLDDVKIKENAISNLSLMILDSIDFAGIKLRRIENYNQLIERLSDSKFRPFINELGENFVPLGFPILTEKRDEIKEKLIDEEIYPPIHWNLENIVPNEHIESHIVSNEILTIPIDQRYNTEDIQRIIKILEKSSN